MITHTELFSLDLKYRIDVSEFAEHGSLHDYLHEMKFQVDYKQRLKWAMQIAKGMCSMYQVGIFSYCFVTCV